MKPAGGVPEVEVELSTPEALTAELADGDRRRVERKLARLRRMDRRRSAARLEAGADLVREELRRQVVQALPWEVGAADALAAAGEVVLAQGGVADLLAVLVALAVRRHRINRAGAAWVRP